MSGKGRFRCIHCGDYFTPDKGTVDDYEEGYTEMPDTCEECCHMINFPSNDIGEMHSDADPGL